MSNQTVETAKLGRGLESLIPKSFLAKGKTITTLPISEIQPNPYQPRHQFNEEELKSLSSSIRQYGLNQPVLVRRVNDGYELIAGERRFRASQMAGLTTIPTIVKDVSDRESLMIALIENIERSDLNAIEEARGYQRLIDEFDMSQQQLAEAFSRSRSAVSNSLRLLKLPAEVQQGLSEGKLSMGHARSLLSLDSDEEILAEYRRLLSGDQQNVRELEQRVAKLKGKGKKKAKFPLLTQVESLLSEFYDSPIEVKGSPKKGKIILSYKSQEEFESLVNVLRH